MADSYDDVQREARKAARDAAREARNAARDAAREARNAARDAAREARNAAREESRRAHDEAREGRQGAVDGTRTEAVFSGDELRRVYIDHTAGRLTLRPCEPGESPRVVSRGSKAAPELRVNQTDDSVTISVKLSLGRLFRRRQGADTDIWLPSGLDELKVEQGAGRIDVEAIDSAAFRLEVGAGDVNVRHTSANIDIQVGAGKVTLRSHRGTAQADTGTGDVSVEFAEAPPGDYDINVGMGSAELRFPPGLQIDARLSSGIGQARNEYPPAGPDAPIHVRMSTGIGRAVLRTAVPYDEPEQRPAGLRTTARPQRGSRTWARQGEAEEMRVLQLMEQGRISPREAADLIAALKGMPPPYTDDEEP